MTSRRFGSDSLERSLSVSRRAFALGTISVLALVSAGCSSAKPPNDASSSAQAGAKIAPPPGGAPARVLADKPATKLGGDTIKIGLVSVLEGSPFAANGKRTVQGAEFAAAQINSNGGVGGKKIELIKQDTRGDVTTTTNILRKLATQDNVLAVVGPILSGECEAGCPVANALGLPILSPGVGKAGVVQKAGPFIFHLVAEDCKHTTASLQAVVKSKGLSSISIIKDVKDPVSKFMGDTCFPDLLKAGGLSPASVETFTSGDSSFAAQVTNLKNKAPQAVILAAGPADAARIAVEMQRQNFTPQLLASGGLQSAGGDFLAAGGKAIDGTIMAAQFDPSPKDSDSAGLIDVFKKQTGDDVTLNAAYAYDAVYILVDMMKQGGITNESSSLKQDREKIKEGMASKVHDWIGMGGPTTLQADGDVQRPAQIATVKDGKMAITVPQ